jgi:hypothetical protein
MLAMFALIAATAPQTAQEAMTLKFKPGEKLVYELKVSMSMFGGVEATGRMPLTITKKDGAKYTVTWPQVDMTPNKGTFQPIKAGSCVITDKGRVTIPDAAGQGAMFLLQMALPEAPTAVGATFPVRQTIGPMSLDMTGKFTKVSEDGAVAVIVADGLLAAQGGKLALHWESHFDIKRGVFRSGTMTTSGDGSTKVLTSFSYKLIE